MAVSDILVTPVRLFHAPLGTDLPDETTVAYGGDWGVDWTEVGFTNAPLSWNPQIEQYDVQAQQRLGTLERRNTNIDLTLETTLIEITGDNLAMALGGTPTTTAAGAAQVGYTELIGGGVFVPDELMWGFEGRYVDSAGNELPIRLFVFRATATFNGALEFAKDSESGIPVQIKALVDTDRDPGEDLFQFQIVTAPATA